MARKRTLEETLASLRRVREAPQAAASRAELRRILAEEGAHAVSRAAALVSELEPVFGGRVDTAVDLRGAAALAIAETGNQGVLALLAELLADPEPPVRISAARAVAGYGSDAGVPLLKLKALSPDPEPRVVSECLLALLRLDASGERAFVLSFLAKSESLAEAAALALGESRSAEAFEALRAWLPEASRRGLSRTALFAIASLRREEALDWLLGLVRDEEAARAREALVALASLRAEAVADRARAAAAERPELQATLAKAFPRTR